MPIQNRTFFTEHVTFLPENQFKEIGECAGKKLLLIGRTKGYGEPIVATSQTEEPSQEDLYAYDLYEMLKLSNEPVTIVEEI